MPNATINLHISFSKFLWILSLIFLGSPYLSCQSEAQNNATQTQLITRDWSKYPAIVEVETKSEIYVIGDIHGDYEGLIELLLAAEIILKKPTKPEKVKWTADNSLLVIPGDFISKGPQSVDVIFLLRALQKSAKKQGGRVILTFGNHEAEFLADTKNVKVKNFRKELKALNISNKAVANGEDELGIGQFLRNLPFAAKVNDWYFVHAGHPKKYSIKELESLIIEGVEKKGLNIPILLDEKEGILEVRMNPRPWWEKKKDDSNDSKSRLRNLLNELGVNHIVVGHQPGTYSFSDGETRKKGKMFQKFNGMIFFVDTGMESKKSDGAVLYIHQIDGRETATIIFPNKEKKKTFWSGN
jgi:Calcineurin-like phosphoesterase